MYVRAYLRASTDEQDATRARAALDAFAHERGLRIAARYTENESGAKLKRPELFRLLADSQAGDVLLIEQVDRLSRLTEADWRQLRAEIDLKQVRIVALDLPTSWSLAKAETYARVLAIRHGRRNKQYSVALNADAKSKIRQMLDKLKEEVERLDISDPKKDAIYSKINALEAELNRSRTRYEVVAALWVESCTKFGEGIEKLEPLRKWINPIADLIGQSKGSERNTVTKIAPPPLRRQIEDKRAVPEIRDGIDDDIPF